MSERRILVIDNYDSFVWNIVSYLGQIGARVDVWRNDDPRFDSESWAESYDGILLSPGPGRPEDAGVCIDVLRNHCGTVPIFGVCLGMQAMAVAWGGTVSRAPEQLHGKVSQVVHNGTGVFEGLPSPLTVTRYHSLAADPDTLPDCLEITATADSAAGPVIMGLRHKELPVEAVQFHPESVLSEHGHQMLAHWLADCGDAGAPGRAVSMTPLMTAS
ncbi:anthranilate synthase component II [Acidipropionibacterium virtanenii]|uniref:Anthranilate synthase component 2 n=1 Tax=Acidipropionibacterium virtanenii TaxID=2057246 RepID=A0A344UX83_9ACTN|nr:gamma-glutamyl-gamma-aminobutyrate hydrolase family protein [Acidipropionibacterium virtanenii]AXE39881.1 Anthranilate synthase component 2 [Acidipropionibacterium virtanenii]